MSQRVKPILILIENCLFHEASLDLLPWGPPFDPIAFGACATTWHFSRPSRKSWSCVWHGPVSVAPSVSREIFLTDQFSSSFPVKDTGTQVLGVVPTPCPLAHPESYLPFSRNVRNDVTLGSLCVLLRCDLLKKLYFEVIVNMQIVVRSKQKDPVYPSLTFP